MGDHDETVPSATPGVRLEQIESFRVEVTEGVDKGASVTSKDGRALVGRAEGVTLRLSDRMVSQFHLEFEVVAGGVRVRDLGSSNGTTLQGVIVRDVVAKGPVELSLGQSRVRLTPGGQPEAVVTSAATQFQGMIGASSAMRAVYTRLQNAAPATSTVLILGESGTGKELAAHALHTVSPRSREAFEIVNCGGLPPTLVEAELFGHAKGAFTGAFRDREGAFERADGGTIFLDEIGELPVESQPKLLRVLECGQFQRVGDTRTRQTNVRVVAATHRELRTEVNEGRFRADLYYRLAVIQVRMPALRERMDDLPRLAEALIARIRKERGVAGDLAVDDALLGALRSYTWPGNVRELRNYLEQWLVLNQQPERPEAEGAGASPSGLDAAVAGLIERPIREAREAFERAYLVGVLERHGWQIIEAARASGIDRVTLFRMMRRYQIERPG